MKKIKKDGDIITDRNIKKMICLQFIYRLCAKQGVLAAKLSCASSQEEGNRADQELGLANRLIGEIQETLKGE